MWGSSGGTPHSQNWPASATSTEMQHRQICVCTGCQLLPQHTAAATDNSQHRDSTTCPSCSPALTAPKNTPWHKPTPPAPSLSLALTNNSFFQLQGKKASCPGAQPRSPCRQLVGRACGRQDRPVLGPSVCPSVRPSCGSPAPGVDVSAPGSRAVGGRHRSYCIKNNTAEHKFITDKCDSQEELTSPSLSA